MAEVIKLVNFGIYVVHRPIRIKNQKYREDSFLVRRNPADRLLAYRTGLHAWNPAVYHSY